MTSRSGLVLDTTILITADRHRESIRNLLDQIRSAHGDAVIAISTISAVELTHGVYRGKSEENRLRRGIFSDAVFRALVVHPLSLEIAQIAGRIEGEQATKGISIPYEDLLIGATALHLGFSVLTHNTKHFLLIPGLDVLAA